MFKDLQMTTRLGSYGNIEAEVAEAAALWRFLLELSGGDLKAAGRPVVLILLACFYLLFFKHQTKFLGGRVFYI